MSKIESIAEREFRDEQLEKELLSFLLRRKPHMIKAIDPSWFGNIVLERVARVVQKHKATMTQTNLLEVMRSDRLLDPKDRAIYLEIIGEIYAVRLGKMNEKSARLACEQLVSLYEGRTMLYGVRDTVKMFGHASVNDIKSKLRELGQGVTLKDSNKSGTYIEGMPERIRVIREKQRILENGGSVGIPTGIRRFDLMTGGIMKAEFGFIAGQSGVGKTAMLTALAKVAWQSGYNVLLVTGEMPKMDIEFRLDSDIAGISATKFRLGNLEEFDIKKWKQAVARERDEQKSFLEIVSFPKDFSVSDIEVHALEVQDKHEAAIDLVCVDYMNIMSPSEGHGRYSSSKDWAAQAEVAWEIKELCADFNDGISLWTGGQVTDDSIDASLLSLASVKYSRAITETFPLVLGLLRNQDDAYEHVLELQIMKMRNAELPEEVIVLHPNLDLMRIHEEVLPKTRDLRDMQPDSIRKKKTDKFRRKKTRRGEDIND